MTGIFRLHDSIRITPSIPVPVEISIPAGKPVFQRKLLFISFIPFLGRSSPAMRQQPHAISFQSQRIWNPCNMSHPLFTVHSLREQILFFQ